jgi:hypothetical protein
MVSTLARWGAVIGRRADALRRPIARPVMVPTWTAPPSRPPSIPKKLRATESYEIARLIEQGVPGRSWQAWDNAALDDSRRGCTQSRSSCAGKKSKVRRRRNSLSMEAEPIDMSPEAIARGSQLFDITCASCHGDGCLRLTDGTSVQQRTLFFDTTSDTQPCARSSRWA